MQDSERKARVKARFEQVQNVRAALNAAREAEDEAAIAKHEERLARLLAISKSPAMTATSWKRCCLVAFPSRPCRMNSSSPRAKASPQRLRAFAGILQPCGPTRQLPNAPLPLADVRANVKAKLTELEANGVPKTLAMFHGGDLEMPSIKLPDRSPFLHYVPDGVAFAVYMFGVDEVMKRLDPSLTFNADPTNAMSEADKATHIAALDADLDRLGREEAALVEAIVARAARHFTGPTPTRFTSLV